MAGPGSAELEDAGALAVTAVAAPDAEAAARAPREGVESAGWPDESAEAAFLAEARGRGEVLAPTKARKEIAEETDARALPVLDELVPRIPPEVREVLDELFRARFVRVVRVPRKALKG